MSKKNKSQEKNPVDDEVESAKMLADEIVSKAETESTEMISAAEAQVEEMISAAEDKGVEIIEVADAVAKSTIDNATHQATQTLVESQDKAKEVDKVGLRKFWMYKDGEGRLFTEGDDVPDGYHDSPEKTDED